MAREVSQMLEVIFTGWRKSGHLDLEAVERAVRGAMHRAGAVAVGHLLSQEPSPAKRVACGCGGQARWHSTRPKRLLTAPGPLEFTRAYYVCPGCHQGHSPRDRELDVVGTECSPGVRRMLAWVGSESSFEQGREQLELLAGLEVTAKAVERQAEFIGADLAAREQDQIRRAPQRELPEVCAPAVPVLYLEMDGTGVPVVKQETEDRAGKIEGLVKLLREVPPASAELAKLVRNEDDYFQRNAERMRYPLFRAQGLFVGSGVVAAGCQTVIASRLNRSGMFWTVRGANAIIALRCCRLSHRFEDYWESRSSAA